MTEYVSTQGYKGTRDFYPEDKRFLNWLKTKIDHVMRLYCFEEYDGPFLEPIELYLSKTSEEIVNQQLYSFRDKGDRHVAIRPEMTPTLARMIAKVHQTLVKPIRWYSMPTCMRYERPQRGRLREFIQLNVDLFGGNPKDEDLEILQIILSLMKSFGAQKEHYEVKISHRALLDFFLLKYVVLDKSHIPSVVRLLDKKDKISLEVFKEEAEKLGLETKAIDYLLMFLDKDLNSLCADLLKDSPDALYLKEILETLKSLDPHAPIEFSSSIVRGFDYYTGLVFEVFDRNPDNRRALFGGGRYDNLIASFGSEPLSGIGFGMGDVTFHHFLEGHHLIPSLAAKVPVSVIRFGEEDRVKALRLCQRLRDDLGLFVEAPLSLQKFGKQIQHAQKRNATCVAFIAQEDGEDGFTLKWLETGVQEHIKFDSNEYKNLSQRF
jgi:histidyl-tRNA synthetase